MRYSRASARDRCRSDHNDKRARGVVVPIAEGVIVKRPETVHGCRMMAFACLIPGLVLGEGTRVLVSKPSREQMDAFARAHEHVDHNYEGTMLAPGGWGTRVIDRMIVVGSGRASYTRAADQLWGLRLGSQEGLDGMHRLEGSREIVTYARSAFGLWCMNPCRVIAAHRGRRRTCVAYGTLRGHLIAGQEWMSVEMDRNSTVTFRLHSVSRGSGPLGTLLFMSLARSMQRRFFRNQIDAMHRAPRSSP